jgi:hypothetical protein
MVATKSKFFAGCVALAGAFTLASCGGTGSPTTSTPPPPSNISVSLNQTSMNLAVNATAQFTATVQNTTNTAVTWSVDGVAGGNATAGTVSASGLYTAPAAAGNHQVTATSVADASKSASATVAVGALGAISPATAVLPPAAQQQFSSSIQGFSNSSITWAVNQVVGGNASVGTITAAGLYTAPSQPGTYTVTATSVADTSVTANASVVVGTLSISPTSATLASSQPEQFTPTASAGVSTLTWSVDGVAGGNATVGAISTSGLYTAPAQAGSHTVTAADGSITAGATVAVVAFSISPAVISINPGTTQSFTDSLQGLSNTAVTWEVDGTVGGSASSGTISTSGLYTAPASIGSHTITAKSVADSALMANAMITVVNFTKAAVLTYHNDDARDGAYLEEVTLTPDNVKTSFGKLLAYPVDGQIYAQPLYMPGLGIAGGTHDVVFVVTQNNSVYAFDADATSSATAQTFWHAGPLGTHVTKNDYSGVSPYVGILSTPVIDASTNTMYLVAEESGQSVSPFLLYALDITTGANKVSPVPITVTVPGSGLDSSGGEITLETDCYQRMGLALDPVNNWIYISFGSCNHGWVLAYDKTTLAYQNVFNDTPDGGGGGLWASGGAPAIDDATGDAYIMSGVDTIDDTLLATGYNDSFLQLSPTDLSLLNSFTPDNYVALAQNDADLGSGADILPLSPAGSTLALGGGKDGNVFVLNLSNGASSLIQEMQVCTDGYDNIFSTPVYWNGSIYFHCNDNVLRAYSWTPGNPSAPLAGPTSSATAVFNMHGATPSLSANGAANGIVWDIDNSAYNTLGTCPPCSPAVLHAYDATNVATELYNSSQVAGDAAGDALKFSVPTIAQGKVFVPTSDELDIYGLRP